jgi:Putative DNA-binding domain
LENKDTTIGMGDLRQVHTKTKQPIGSVGSVNKRLCTNNWTRRYDNDARANRSLATGVSEHQRLEFKAAKNGLDRTKLNEYCVAIANEGGGHLILGISDKPSIPLFVTVVRSSCANEVLVRSGRW